MSTTSNRTYRVPGDGQITLPPEYRGKTVRLDITTDENDEGDYSIADFVEKYSGILKDCEIESVERMKEDRINHLFEKYQ